MDHPVVIPFVAIISPDVIGAHDDEVEEVPDARVGHVLEDELPHQVVRVVRVAVQEGGQQAQELQLLKEEKDGTLPGFRVK